MSIQYTNELEGQQDFLKAYLPRVDRNLSIDDIQHDYSDGIVRGNILEFKLNISDLNAVLFQAVKYLSAMRVKGQSIPANILLISLNTNEAYLYHSADYLPFIERTYTGGASVGNTGFTSNDCKRQFNLNDPLHQDQFIATLRTDNYTPIHLDENCIVGWAMRYYREFPEAKKSDFIGDDTGKVRILGEIRRPDKYKNYILPYTKKSNERFKYLMDKLNDFLQKKNLGAFYTHTLYAQKALELVRQAIQRVPEGNDYVIIDRCAGTGNLERQMTHEELSHTIVSTLEYYEYKVLSEELGDKVRHIIPPTEGDDTFNMGLVRGADALSEEYINSPILKQYIDNPNCTIILFENPPYSDTTSIEHQKRNANSGGWKNSYAVQQMKKEVKGTATNDLGNAFIWTAFKYYLRQPTDSYIVFSPVKYWKAHHLINKRFIRGYAFNRKHFHTNIQACIMCALWSNEEDCNLKELTLQGYDILNEYIAEPITLDVKRIYSTYSKEYFDKCKFSDDIQEGILCEKNGYEKLTKNSIRVSPILNDNIIGYMAVYSSGFDNPDNMSSLLTCARYDGNGFYLRKDNYLEKLPLFAASRYITYNRQWTERSRIMKSGDGADRFHRDVKNGRLTQWLLQCLLFTCLEPQNHMRSFRGSDGRNYTCHLSLDSTHGDTIALRDLKALVQGEAEQELIALWEKVLVEAKKTKGYNQLLTYGLYQIKTELNTSYKSEVTGRTVYDYPALNGHINTLSEKVKAYYNSIIVPVLFRYEFLK